MLKKILIGLAVVIIVFLIVVALQPSEYHVTRSTTMAAPPEAVFPHVNELKKWAAWNPWERIDPNMKLTYEGPEAGVGASYSWVGNSEVGEGKMTITGSRLNESVQLKLEFFKPMASVSDTEFTFKPQGNQTEVTWAMSGKNNFIGKAFCLFMNMDKMIGGQFEKGLTDLKTITEQATKLDGEL
ncbi:MAG: SRPBCC family protein [Verrucomicrobiae bacterium]|nr:SRPBCC family protein [Verrucomicrobiae bacterium]